MIGRKREREQLLEAFSSADSELVAVYGRRRVGKTFLVRETFGNGFAFQHTGVKKGTVAVQLACFRQSLVEHGHAQCPELKNWFEVADMSRTIHKENEDFTYGFVSDVITRNITPTYIDYNLIKNQIREELGKYIFEETECKPMIIAVVQEV